jgi:hypothetical protein
LVTGVVGAGVGAVGVVFDDELLEQAAANRQDTASADKARDARTVIMRIFRSG